VDQVRSFCSGCGKSGHERERDALLLNSTIPITTRTIRSPGDNPSPARLGMRKGSLHDHSERLSPASHMISQSWRNLLNHLGRLVSRIAARGVFVAHLDREGAEDSAPPGQS